MTTYNDSGFYIEIGKIKVGPFDTSDHAIEYLAIRDNVAPCDAAKFIGQYDADEMAEGIIEKRFKVSKPMQKWIKAASAFDWSYYRRSNGSYWMPAR